MNHLVPILMLSFIIGPGVFEDIQPATGVISSEYQQLIYESVEPEPQSGALSL